MNRLEAESRDKALVLELEGPLAATAADHLPTASVSRFIVLFRSVAVNLSLMNNDGRYREGGEHTASPPVRIVCRGLPKSHATTLSVTQLIVQ